MRRITLCPVSAFIMCILVDIISAHAASYRVTNPDAMRKVQPDALEAGPRAALVRIAMALREYEPAQIVVSATGRDLTGVRVTVSDLVAWNDVTLPSGRVTINPMAFIRCRAPSTDSAMAGWVPDVLLPDKPMDIQSGRRQPFYLTMQTLPDDEPGEYHGLITVSADNDDAVEVPLVVRVYGVTLPVRSHLRTAFGLWVYHPYNPDFARQSQWDLLMSFSKQLLAHRISPCTFHNTISPWRQRDGSTNRDGPWDFSASSGYSALDRFIEELLPLGLNALNIGDSGSLDGARSGDEPLVKYAKAVSQHLKERGWWDLAYAYGWDEAPKDKLPLLQKHYRAVVEAVPDLRIMQTDWNPHPDLKGLVKIWCPTTDRADLAALRAARDAGDEVWWYVWAGPFAPYPNFAMIGNPGIDCRILGWMSYHYQIDGFLYWAVDKWDINRLTAAEYARANYANWDPHTYKGGRIARNGDGYLFYPGADGFPIPSLRLAMVRDGFEDYDLFKEVEALAANSGPAAESARPLLMFDPELIRDRADHTIDAQALLSRREALLRAAEDVAREQQ